MQALATRIRGPVAVVGDVHGQTEKLDAVLDKLRALPDFHDRWIVFIGDLVDRGPDPRGALDAFLDLRDEHPRATMVCGNHELAMATALGLVPAGAYSAVGQDWLDVYDSETTFESYGVEPGDVGTLAERLPSEHAELIAGLPWCVEHPDYLFVHAGVDPNLSIELQLRVLRQRDFTLNRPKWLCSQTLAQSGTVPGDCRATVVSGHVCVPRVVLQDRRIRLDTTGGLDGDLSCVLLPEKKVITSGEAPAAAGRGGWKLFGWGTR